MIELTSSISGHIKPNACIEINSEEVIKVSKGFFGIIGLRRSLAAKGLILGATIIESGYCGTIKLQIINKGYDTFEIKKGDRIVNLACSPLCYEIKVM